MSALRAPIVEEVLLLEQVVARVPGRAVDVRAWVRNNVRARRGPTGLHLYLWSEVVAALPEDTGPVVAAVAPGPSPTLARVRY